MVRQLKTFVTSLGFFEEAVAAPSMKAALDAWGSSQNLFQQGFAKEVDDPAIVAAAMKRQAAISDKIKTEESNWNNEKDKLQAAIEKAKN